MQYMLISVTVVSAAVAMVMCAIVIRMLRDERRRSDARVEALLALADEPRARDLERDLEEDPPLETLAPARPERARHRAVRVQAEPPPQPAPPEPDRTDLELNPGASVTGVAGLFAERETRAPWGSRLGVAAALGALLVAGTLAFSSWERRPGEEGAAKPATIPSSGTPLELLSLGHTAEAHTLTITGLVQNPRKGAALERVTAVALLFAQDGGFVASGRAPLDFTRLEPGAESPFVVQVPKAKGVARYRISFRGEDGSVIAHVDKRSAGPLAQRD